jgi:hypothetical protein
MELGVSGKLHLQVVPLDSGGYDPGGAYWGRGSTLFCVWGTLHDEFQGLRDEFYLELYFRSNSRKEVKALVLDRYENVTFYK